MEGSNAAECTFFFPSKHTRGGLAKTPTAKSLHSVNTTLLLPVFTTHGLEWALFGILSLRRS